MAEQAIVVVEGPGTYRVPPYKFLPGRTACDDERVLEAVRNGPDWVTIEYGTEPGLDDPDAQPSPAPLTTQDLVSSKPRCDLCDREFQTLAGLKSHLRIKHPEPEQPDAIG